VNWIQGRAFERNVNKIIIIVVVLLSSTDSFHQRSVPIIKEFPTPSIDSIFRDVTNVSGSSPSAPKRPEKRPSLVLAALS
jgi:hypothetical protein